MRMPLRSVLSAFLSLSVMSLAACKTAGTADQAAVKGNDDNGGASLVAARFHEPLDELRKMLVQPGAGTDAVIKTLVDQNARFHIMKVEGELDLYKKSHGKDLAKADALATAFSDELSVYQDRVAFTKVAVDANAPVAVTTWLRDREGKAHGKFSRYLEDEAWVATKKNPLDKMRDAVDAIDWPGQKKDREYVREHLHDALKDVKKTDYDLDDLENGIHRFRRHVRWVLIKMSSSQGLVQGDEGLNPIAAYAPMLQDKVAMAKKYSQLPTSSLVKKPILISKSVFMRAVRLVEEIGIAKDVGMAEEALAEAFLATGLAKKKGDAAAAATRVAQANPAFHDFFAAGGDVKAKATEIYKEFKEQILPELISELKQD